MQISRQAAEPPSGRGARVAVALLALLLAARYYGYLFSSEPLRDEIVYLDAGRAMIAGVSPYSGPFLYLPLFAWAAGRLLELAGETIFLGLLRAANFAAAVAFVWLGAAKSGFGGWRRWLLAALFLLGAPSVLSSLGTGNPTFLIGLLIFAGLEQARRRPFAAGALLGASLLLKPLAPGAVAWLAGCRSGRGAWGLPPALLAGAILAAGFFPLGLAGEFLRQQPPPASLEHNPSLFRLLESAGLALPPAFFTALGCLAVLAVAARREREEEELYLWALPSLLLVLPLVWNHTLCLSWPIQAAAFGLAARRGRRLEVASVLATMVLLACWHGIHALPLEATVARFVFTAAPALAPVGLAAYVLLLAKPRPA